MNNMTYIRKSAATLTATAVSVLLTFATASCSDGKDARHKKSEDATESKDKTVKVAEVTVAEAVETTFDHELMSNGKVKGHEQAELRFDGNDVITAVYVHNGQNVRKGQRLAAMDSFGIASDLEKAHTTLAKAELDMKDALIGQGYDPNNLAEVPQNVLRLARLRSGYIDAEQSINTLKRKMEQTVMSAPFDGTVADLTAKAFNRPDGSKPAMRIIGNNKDVAFTILENELQAVRQGDAVDVAPYATGETYRGRISEINPVVDENGLVTVTASVASARGLYDGMNVRVSVKKDMGRQLVVPKSAVVLRTGRQVVFTLSEDGSKAIWNYVTTGLENMSQYTVTAGLKPGAKVIVSGNEDLAHEAPVRVKDAHTR